MLPAPCQRGLQAEASVVDALADEARFDSARAAKASSYSATVGSRYRGRQTRGGRITLVSAVDRLELEEWEVQRLIRLLPGNLQRALRSLSTLREGQTARGIADVLGTGD